MKRNIQRRDVLKGAGAAGLAGLAGCLGGNGNGNGGSAETIQYGILMPETGDLGDLGVTIRDGARLVSRQLEGEVDFEFDTATRDTQTDPQTGLSEAEDLINEGYPAVVGPAASNVNLQVTESVFIPNEVVGISPSSTAPAVTDLDDNDFIFRTCPSDALQGQVMANVALDNRGASTSATLYLNDDYGQALEEEYVAAFEDGGGEVTAQVSFEPEQSSYSSQLGEALGDDPDVLMVVGFPQSGIQLFRDYYSEYDTGAEILVPDGLRSSSLPDEVDNPMNNVYGTSPSSQGPGADAFASAYEEEWGNPPEVFNGQAYDAAAVITLARVAAGENSGTGIRDSLRDVANPDGDNYGPGDLADAVSAVADGDAIDYQGASSSVDFDDNGDMRAVFYEIFKYEEGDIEALDTIEFEA
ncbi:ABC transporter substrate-binding protein [Natronomonas gomsonensis]|uniref:ABC transporter substrate-binding protein n=1 Tax=Natronomonas gomsonensis TaxID=1046043 RepID=UPI0015C07FB0|nr:ABC transporter substrate-binding protein [Natronomonas gomsonensis]